MAKKSKTCTIDRDAAIDLLKQLEYKGVNKADDDKLVKMLTQLPKKLEDGDDDDLNKKARRTLDDVTEAVNDKVKIEVAGEDDSDDDDDEDEAPKKSAKKGAKKEAKADKKSAKKGKDDGKKKGKKLKTSKGGKGEFSLRTQQGHELNRLLEKGPLTIEEAVKKSKVDMTEKRAEAHLDYLVEKGRATKTKKGKYTLV